MPSLITISISCGRGQIAMARKRAYRKAARKKANGNLSRMVLKILDKALGLNLPLPTLGRPPKAVRYNTRHERP